LLAKAVGQSLKSVIGIPHSRASPLPHLGCIPRLEPGCAVRSNAGSAPRIPSPNSDQNCGSGLARESGGSVAAEGGWSGAFAGKPAPTFGVYSKVGIWLCRLLKCRCSTPNSSPNSNQNCGSGLARESGGSFAGEGGWSGAFAGKPAPTFGLYFKVGIGLCRLLKCRCSTPNSSPNSDLNCGSGLARESGGSVAGEGGWSGAFASKPAPTFGVYFKVRDGLCLQLKCLCSTPNPKPEQQSKLWERACSRKRWVSRCRR